MSLRTAFLKTTLLVGLAGLTGMLVRTLYAHVLPPDAYGALFSLQALITFLIPFLNLGMGEALNYFIPREAEAWKSYLTIALLVTLVTSSLAAFIFLILAPIISTAYLHTPIFTPIVRAFSIGILAWPLFLVLRNALRARGRPEAYPLGDVLLNTGRLAFIKTPLLIIALGWNILVLTLTLLYTLPFRSVFTRPRLQEMRRLLSYSLPNMLSAVIIILLTSIDIILLTLLAPLTSVAVYSANLPYLTIPLFLLQPIIILYYPLLSPLHGRAFTREAQRGFLTASLLLTLSGAFILPLLPTLLKLLLPAAYQPSILLISILLTASILGGITRYAFILLSAQGLVRERFTWTLSMILLNLLLDLILIPRYLATGAALGTLIASLPGILLLTRLRISTFHQTSLSLLILLTSIPAVLIHPLLSSLLLTASLLPYAQQLIPFIREFIR